MEKYARTNPSNIKNPTKKRLVTDKSNLASQKKQFNENIKMFNKHLKDLKNQLHGNVEGKERIRLDEKLPENLTDKLYQLADYFKQQADLAANIPLKESSSTKQFSGRTCSISAVRKKTAGFGLPYFSCSAETKISK